VAPQISLVVSTLERPEDLRRSLPSYLANIDDLSEIIVVDQSRDDRTCELLADYATDRRVRYVRCPQRGLSNARNVGFGLASSAIVGFTDDDCLLPEGWARQVALHLADEGLGAFFGAVRAEPFDSRVGHTPSVPWLPDRTIERADLRIIPGIMGANMAFRREAFAAIGGFDTVLGAGGPLKAAEEMDAAYRVLLAGYRVALRPAPMVVHFGFRQYATGASRAVVCATHLGMAAYYGKHIRAGDVGAMKAYARYLGGTVGRVGRNLRRGERPLGVSRVAYTLLGLAQSFRYQVDRRHRLFVRTAANDPRAAA
jgi:glycosyltransferase involved in cell wall biosynthesis